VIPVALANSGDEYLPSGKESMVLGGIGAIRLKERTVRGAQTFFVGGSSTGIAHQGIPIAMGTEQYHKVISQLRELGGCRATMVGSLQSIGDGMPSLNFDIGIPRYCFVAEELTIREQIHRDDVVVTAAIMFNADRYGGSKSEWRDAERTHILEKSWTFCSFSPASEQAVRRAADWLFDYASRYSDGSPVVLTDFDEHQRLFPSRVEFPLSQLINGRIEWETLRAYSRTLGSLFINTYIEEFRVMGDQINVVGSGNTIINHSTVEQAFNMVRSSHDEETAKVLLQIEQAINKSGNADAADNFNSFNEELKKPQPKKSLLKSLWQGTLAAMPAIEEIPGVIEKVRSLFN
jgi:hypothetical protein